MKIIVANVDKNAKSNKHIDLKMKRKLSQLRFISSYVGKYDLISNDFEERIYLKVKNLLNSYLNKYSSYHTQYSKMSLKYYSGIKYIVIMIHKEKIQVNALYDTGINLGNNRFADLTENKKTGEIDLKRLFTYSF